jgi:ABC-type glycerol-3-phosphate transport system permease component
VFARYDFPGKRIFFYLFLGLLMIPSILTLIPLFLEVKGMGLLNNWLALILPYIAGGQAITVFVLQAFFSSLPEEMFEAARIDGASEFQAFVRIAIPLSSAILGAMAIISALGVWGDYLWPTIVLQDSHLYTISAGIANYVSSFGLVAQVGPTFASYVLASLPVVILIILTMKYYVTGLTTGALKLSGRVTRGHSHRPAPLSCSALGRRAHGSCVSLVHIVSSPLGRCSEKRDAESEVSVARMMQAL